MSSNTSESSPPPPKSGSMGWEIGVDRYRDATTWVIGTFGAIGALIVATLPIAGLTDSEVRSSFAVVAGVVIAAAGTLFVILAALWSITPQAVYPATVHARRRNWFQRTFMGWAKLEDELAVNGGRYLPAGISNPDELDQAITNLPRLAAIQSASSTDGAAVHATVDRLTAYRAARRALYGLARFELARTRFAVALAVMVIGVVSTVAGLGTATWGLVGTSATVARGGETQAATASLTRDGRDTLAALLGAGCVAGNVDVIVLAGDRSSSAWDVVTTGSNDCNVARFTLLATLGTLRWK